MAELNPLYASCRYYSRNAGPLRLTSKSIIKALELKIYMAVIYNCDSFSWKTAD